MGVVLSALNGAAAEEPAHFHEIRQAIEQKGLEWTVGETSLSWLSESERRIRGGALALPSGVAPPYRPTDEDRKFAAQVSFDWRDADGNYLTDIRDQGQCGSCWAFAIMAALESSYKIEARDPEWILNGYRVRLP